jgi:hypothetical protein
VDLFYLQAALLRGEWIDAWVDESRVVDFVRQLPSAETWLANVRERQHDCAQPTATDSEALAKAAVARG